MTKTFYEDYYDGSKLFQFVSNRIGLPIDLVNFLIAQIAALCLARLFRKPLRVATPEFRHSMCLILGLIMGYFCFGKQAIHLSVLPMLTYTLLKTTPHHLMGNIILAASMFYLSCVHLHRQIYHTASYTMDITGPLMVITQRVTALAYSIQDELQGIKSKSVFSGQMLRKIPSPLEYFAYTLAFQTLMCGPFVFYSDYINFIEGKSVTGEKGEQALAKDPSPKGAVFYKVIGSIGAAVLYLSLGKKYPIVALEDLTDPTSEVSQSSAFYLLWYAYLSTLVVRCKYYHAWLLSEAICNNSGMGFNGYDTDGQARWDKVSNIDILGFEMAQNFRVAIASWNKNTNTWLRGVAYERGGAAWRTARVYALSALWHGFHPGYYLTFLAGGLFTVSARKVRLAIRPAFVNSRPKKLFYDTMSFVSTRIAMTYTTVPFVLLHLAPSLAFYGKLYYSLHLIAIGALLIPEPPLRQRSVNKLNSEATLLSNETAITENGDSNGKLKIT